MGLKKVLMCRPTYFDVEYSINPWMDVNNRVDKKKAEQQWESIYQTLSGLGVGVELIPPVPGLPDMTFSGDCGLLHGKKILASNFRHPERQAESQHYNQWLRDHGYELFYLPDDLYFEGLGDVALYGNDIIFGSGSRSSPEALKAIKDLFPELNVLGELQIEDEAFYHSTLAIALIGKETVLYYRQAFTNESARFIERKFKRSIALTERDAKEYFVCSNIVVGNKILIDDCTPGLEEQLRIWGYEVIKCDASEFKKSGASVRCFILNL